MPAIYISKYNRFVDNIIGRINRILGKSYDPVRVKLLSNQSKKNKKNSSKTKKRKNTKKPNEIKNKMAELSIARSTESESREPAFVLISKAGGKPTIKNNTIPDGLNRATSNKVKKNKKKSNKRKNTTEKAQNSRARATLYGLSSIKREGDVTVNMMSNYTTVKTDFILGPLTLRVEREFGRGAKRELKSATATTAEMYGRLNLKIIHGGAATLQTIRVLQPKQVRVESADNHEKTKEFMWKRSYHIASLVSQKLASAVRSMLKPPPTTA